MIRETSMCKINDYHHHSNLSLIHSLSCFLFLSLVQKPQAQTCTHVQFAFTCALTCIHTQSKSCLLELLNFVHDVMRRMMIEATTKTLMRCNSSESIFTLNIVLLVISGYEKNVFSHK